MKIEKVEKLAAILHDKHGDIKLVTAERRMNYPVSEPHYYTTKFFIEYLLATEMKKNRATYE